MYTIGILIMCRRGDDSLSQAKTHHQTQLSIHSLCSALFIVNRHAKTALNPKFLYELKKATLCKMIIQGNAKKIGLHYSPNPRNSQQRSDVLIQCGEYTFHLPPTKEDFLQLPHLGKLDDTIRNPKYRMNLREAKGILEQYTGMKENKSKSSDHSSQKYQKPVFKKLGERFF